MTHEQVNDIKTIYKGLIESVKLNNLTVNQAHSFLHQLIIDNHLEITNDLIDKQFDEDIK